MDFESPDVAKDFPGLYASENMKRSQSRDSEYSDDEKSARKDLLGKKKDKKESKKDKGYVVFEGESSADEMGEAKSPSKSKKNKSAFKFPGKDKKDKHNKSKDKENKEKKEEKEKVCKKESKERKDSKESERIKVKKKKENKLLKIKDKKKKNGDQAEEKPLFGVSLHIAVERSKSYDGIELPVVVRECIDYIEEHGLACEGIYKISGLKSKVRNLKQQYNSGEKIYLYEHEPHIIASLLKQFLRELPEPILTSSLMPKFEEACALKNEQKRLETFQKLLNELPNCNRLLLSWIFVHMQHVIALERRNKMTLQNVSIVLSPTMQMSHNVLQTFFAHANILFKGIELKKYVPPIELDSTRLSLELPDSPSAIAEELSKQENVLNVLHAELNTGLRDQQKEEQLWEIQRVVTQLKRKLRFLKQLEGTSTSQVDDSQAAVQTKKYETSKTTVEEKSVKTVPLAPSVASPSSPAVPKTLNGSENKQFPVKTELPEAFDTVDSKPILIKSENSLKKPNVKESALKEKDDSKVENQDVQVKNEKQENTINSIPPSVKTKFENEEILPVEIDANLPKLNSERVKSCAENSKKADEEYEKALIQEEKMLRIQCDELVFLGDELRRKINSEKLEIERLKLEINEYQQLYKYKRYAFDSTENSSSESDDSIASECDDEDLSTVLQKLMKKNKQLEESNKEVTKSIQLEREVCLNIKVKMKLL